SYIVDLRQSEGAVTFAQRHGNRVTELHRLEDIGVGITIDVSHRQPWSILLDHQHLLKGTVAIAPQDEGVVREGRINDQVQLLVKIDVRKSHYGRIKRESVRQCSGDSRTERSVSPSQQHGIG